MKRLNLALLVILAFALVLAPASTPAASAQSVPMVAYTVQPGDTLAKIAARYCTTWEEIYQINAAVIGPDPNVLKPGTVLYVPNRCAAPPSNCAVYDHGPSMYANGTVSGNVYTVAAGDTWYSVGVRFGLPWETISAANGGGGLYPGRQLIIPGLCSSTPPPAQKSYLSITNPQAGANLPATFTVSGKGAGLIEGNVVVTAKDSAGRILAQKATTLQGPNVGVGGEGTWSTSLTVNASTVTSGAIEATSPGVPAMAAVSITYSGAGSSGGGSSGDQRGVRARSMHDLRPARRADVPVSRRPDGRAVRDRRSGRGEAAHGLQQHGLVHDPAGSLDGQPAHVGAGHQPVVGREWL